MRQNNEVAVGFGLGPDLVNAALKETIFNFKVSRILQYSSLAALPTFKKRKGW